MHVLSLSPCCNKKLQFEVCCLDFATPQPALTPGLCGVFAHRLLPCLMHCCSSRLGLMCQHTRPQWNPWGKTTWWEGTFSRMVGGREQSRSWTWMSGHYVLGFAPAPRFRLHCGLCRSPSAETINQGPLWVYACKNITYMRIKDRVVHVRVLWIMETLK